MNIRVHYSWIPVFALVTAIVTTQFSEDFSLWRRIILGLVVALLFLVAAVIREFILNTAAFRRETSVTKITLFPFGGVYGENKDRIVLPHWPLLYLARYLSNLVIAVIFWGLYATFINAGDLMLAGLAQWLAYIYFLLFLLHFIPAFPLDGGEILRMFLWKSTGDFYKATGTASLIGWASGLVFIFAGVLVLIINQQWSIGLTIIFIGWLIQLTAQDTRRRIKMLVVLHRIQARDILTREYAVMPPHLSVGQLIRDHLLLKGYHYTLVIDGTGLKGILTLQQIKSVPEKSWNKTTLGDIMTPSKQMRTAQPDQTADTLYEEMSLRGLDYLPVLDNGKIIGVVTRNALTGLVNIRSGFGA